MAQPSTEPDGNGPLPEDVKSPDVERAEPAAGSDASPAAGVRSGGTDERSALADMASTIVDAAQAGVSSVARPILHGVEGLASGVEGLASGARRALEDRGGARVRRVRRMGHRPLVNLWDEHPEARRASIRELGLQTVPVDEIAGTAVEGAPQRGGDFLPLRDRRSDDWRARWQRILRATENLMNLPPVELIKFGDRYWVVDGHNRVAAALYNGQVAIDAVVDELRLPGVGPRPRPMALAAVLEGSSDLRQAGSGRFSRTTVRPERLPERLEPDHDHAPDGAPEAAVDEQVPPARDATPPEDGEDAPIE